MGFIKNGQDLYVPNTALKQDIRDITDDRKKIIAVLKKNINEKLYKNITYLKQTYQVEEILKNIEGIAFHHFDKKDVIRHRLVSKILEAYDNADNTNV